MTYSIRKAAALVRGRFGPREGTERPRPHHRAARRVGGGTIAALALVAGVALSATPASAYHSKVSTGRTVELRKGWWQTHVRVSHWTPDKYVKVFVCNPGYTKRGVVACDETNGLVTDSTGRARTHIYLYGGPVGDGRCDFQFDGCSIVVMQQNPRTSRLFPDTAVAVPIALSS